MKIIIIDETLFYRRLYQSHPVNLSYSKFSQNRERDIRRSLGLHSSTSLSFLFCAALLAHISSL